MASGFFLLSSAAVGNRMIMSPRIHEETNSVTKRLTSFSENSASSSGCFLRILTLMILLSSAFFSVWLPLQTEPSCYVASQLNLDLNVSKLKRADLRCT